MNQSMKQQLRKSIVRMLEETSDMAVATNRPDGYPQTTTVSFASDGLTIYFVCGENSQKAANLGRDNRVSCSLTPPYDNWNAIRGLSLAGRAHQIMDFAEQQKVRALFVKKFPQIEAMLEAEPVEQLAVFRIEPEVVSVLDYTQGFGHTDQLDLRAAA